MSTRFIAILVIAALSFAADDRRGGSLRGDLTALRGTWVVDSYELNGRRLGSVKSAMCMWTVAGKSLSCTNSEGEKVSGAIEIDETKTPKTLNIIWSHTAGTTLCIYELKENVFRIGHFAPDRYYMPSKDRPAKFEIDAGMRQDLYVAILKRR
jgi:uncharacterized protein (TIGR03067 family)